MVRTVAIAVPVPLSSLLTYRVPEGLELPVPGARVVVPLGSRLVTGIAMDAGPAHADAVSPDSLKEIVDILDASPFVPDACLKLALWVAEYYACAPGDTVSATLPPLSTLESRLVVDVTAEGRHALSLEGVDGLAGLDRETLRVIGAAKHLPVSTLKTRVSAVLARPTPVAIMTVLRRLESFGLVSTARVLEGERAAYKTERVVALTLPGRDVAQGIRNGVQPAGLGPRQRSVLLALVDAPNGLTTADLRALALPTEGLHRLEQRGLVAIERRTVDRDPFVGPWGTRPAETNPVPADLTLTAEQTAAVESLWEIRRGGGFQTALLHGVTGSGKTEVYLQMAGRVRAVGERVLVLVPEIGLTPAVASAFRERFGNQVAVQHSGLSDGERHDQWQRIRRGEVGIVVGTRSAVFAPLDNIGVIVVDEEHDASYKQDENPRYHGRDVALVRGKLAGALVVLGSATPSMESYGHALAGRYRLIELEERVQARPLATVDTVNMRDEYATSGPDTILSARLVERIQRCLDRREQALLLLNRRGLSTAVFCRQCGGHIECPNCSVSLVVSGRGFASCHYCNYVKKVPRTCPTCGAPYLELMGYGTERVEREVMDRFPHARVARLDRDAVKRRGALPSILAEFRRGGLDILVGTQMIAKGHDFPRVTLVGVISADVGLGLADFRASERTFQLLTQVVGRAGRGELPGEALVQTVYPEHYSIRHACRQDFKAFFADEQRFRQAMKYPPTTALINGLVRGTSGTQAMERAQNLVRAVGRAAIDDGRFVVLGPAPAPLARLKGEHRAQFFVKGRPAARVAMREAVKAALEQYPDLKRHTAVDIDPLTVL